MTKRTARRVLRRHEWLEDVGALALLIAAIYVIMAVVYIAG